MRTLFLLLASFVSSFAVGQLTLLGHLPYPQNLNDVWGYVDELGNEYALVGADSAVSIVDVTNPNSPVEVFNVAGPSSIWRDLKTWGDYAYITNETSGGLMIIDLSPLPQSTNLPVTYFTGGGLSKGHNLFIDENGVCYIFGGNLASGGVVIYDLTVNPTVPQFLGNINTWYAHDGIARGDTLYVANQIDGFFSIYDVSDKANPVLLGSHNTPHNGTHNIWVSDDGDYVFTTDEVNGAFITAYDISDLNNITETDRIQSSPGNFVVPHNTHYINGYLVTSYYRDGVTVHDAHRPENLALIDDYDTSPLSGAGMAGAWGAYPWLPSGNILVSDMQEGLFVFGMNYHRASYLEGNITDSICGVTIPNAVIQITPGVETASDLYGNFKMGTHLAGTYTVTINAMGYPTHTFPNVTLSAGNLTTRNFTLYSPSSVLVEGVVVTAGNSGISGAQIQLSNANFSQNLSADTNGYFAKCNIPSGTYEVSYGKWGYQSRCTTVVIGAVNNLVLELEPGYSDDFSLNYNWGVGGNALAGNWTRVEPIGTTDQGFTANPDADVPDDCYDKAYVTGNGTGAANDFDLDGGNTILTSPVFDLTSYPDPYISYHRWYYKAAGGPSSYDPLIISLSNGTITIDLEKIIISQPSWVEKSFRVSDFLTPTSTMTISFDARDAGSDNLIEAGVDNFKITGDMVGGKEEQTRVNLLIFPNPSSDSFSLQSESAGIIRVYDLTGKVILEEAHCSGTSTFGEGLPQGIYLISLSGDNYPTLTQRLIKFTF